MIVVDASAALAALLTEGPARQAITGESLHAPHLIDPEVTNGLRRRVAAGDLTDELAWDILDVWRRLAIARYPVNGLIERLWDLRANVSSYDASYVALAEALGCGLLTADARLARAPGVRCPITVVPA